jgi:hypothetical protein
VEEGLREFNIKPDCTNIHPYIRTSFINANAYIRAVRLSVLILLGHYSQCLNLRTSVRMQYEFYVAFLVYRVLRESSKIRSATSIPRIS